MKLAKLSGVDRTTIENYLYVEGKGYDSDTLEKIALALNIKLSWLKTGEEDHGEIPPS